MNDSFNDFVDLLRSYGDHRIDAKSAVAAINRFVSDDKAYDLPVELQGKVLALQDKAGRYVSDPKKRREYEGYFGEAEFRLAVFEFLKSIHN